MAKVVYEPVLVKLGANAWGALKCRLTAQQLRRCAEVLELRAQSLEFDARPLLPSQRLFLPVRKIRN